MNLEAHLNELPASDAEAFRAAAARLRGLPEREPSADLTDRILAAVELERARERRPRFRLPPRRWIAAAAAAAAVAAISLLWLAPGARTDAPLRDGYAWLAANQELDGAWSPSRHGGSDAYRPALTALSALALAQAPHAAYATQLRRAATALAAQQTADGAFGGEGRAQLYNHAIATYALASLCSGQPELRPALSRALAFARARQTPQGGWDYEPRSDGNAAVTAWQVRALASAEALGLEEARAPLRKGLRWLRGAARDDGSVAYHADSGARSDSLNALAAHALLAAGQEFPELAALGRHVAASLGADAGAGADCYRDYAKVLAFESAGEGKQADAVRRCMAKRQAEGSRDQWESVGGKLYTTALTVLAAQQRRS